MKIEELENALNLQRRAYGLLLWLSREASNTLDEEALGSPSRCAEWAKHYWNQLPGEFRPVPADTDAFARMLSSFFNTSFHLDRSRGVVRLVRGRKFKDKRNKKYATDRTEKAAAQLERAALASLAADESIQVENADLSEILGDDALTESAGLWAYGCELVRRSQFASQGPAVHHLWLELDEKKRKRLDAEAIWKARTVLVKALRRKEAEYEQR